LVDPQNLIFGSTHNKPATDIQVGIFAKDNHVEVGLSYENFKEIEYQNLMLQVNYVYPIKQFQIVGGVGSGIIIRYNQYTTLTYELNTELRYYFTKNVGVFVKGNLQNRGDVEEIKYRYSNYVGIVGRF